MEGLFAALHISTCNSTKCSYKFNNPYKFKCGHSSVYYSLQKWVGTNFVFLDSVTFQEVSLNELEFTGPLHYTANETAHTIKKN